KDHAEARRDDEEPDVPDEALPRDFEGPNQRHGSCDDRTYEASGSDKLSNCKAATMRAHGRKGGEDVGTPVSEGQQGDARHAFAHAEHVCNCAEVDTEEVAGSYANSAEEQTKPYD
ncbi:hypothetical protein LTR16_008763, partial [Cryomyces antarcticus]